MKKFVVIVVAAVALGALVGCLDQGTGSGTNKGPLLRYHFAGRANIGKDGTATLATRLKAAGFATGAFVAAFPLTKQFGLAPGFDVYDD